MTTSILTHRLLAGVAAAGLLAVAPAASAQDVKIGALFGVTGPIANFIPPILDAAQLAVDDVNANGGILDGQELRLAVGDTQGVAQARSTPPPSWFRSTVWRSWSAP